MSMTTDPSLPLPQTKFHLCYCIKAEISSVLFLCIDLVTYHPFKRKLSFPLGQKILYKLHISGGLNESVSLCIHPYLCSLPFYCFLKH